ncbi:coronin-6-like [Diadema antillarum]|uniref:coronin-6-like n=1 Tax=Diadema antillarum TaxID=105358 RepID=UPI003A8BFE2A
MSGRFVRDSKLRNVFGQAFKKDLCFESIQVSKHQNVGMCCAVNTKFLAVVTESGGGGTFLVLPHDKTGRLDANYPQVMGHQAAVLDLAWSPFNDNLIASCDDNGVIKLWQIPDGGLTEPMTEKDELMAEQVHQKRVSAIKFHPTVENVLLTAGVDGKICIWDLDSNEILKEFATSSVVQDICWNYDGSRIGYVCKDKKVRVHNAVTGDLVAEFEGHESPREQRLVLLKDNRVLTTGFTRRSEREYKVWDLNAVSKPLVHETLDQTNAPLSILYDPDLNMAYFVGKGDTVIRYYELTPEAPYIHYITTYQSSSPQKGMGYMPKRGCNVNLCEVARLYKAIDVKGFKGIEPVSFIVPRKSDLYHKDIYPDTASNEPAASIQEWQGGKACSPKTMNMEQFYIAKAPSSGTGSGGLKSGGLKAGGGLKRKEPQQVAEPAKPAAPAAVAPVKAPTPKAAPSPAPATGQSQQIEDLVAEIAKLKATVAEQEKRIAVLESLQERP